MEHANGEIMYNLRAVGVVVAALAAVLLAGQPASAAPAHGVATSPSVTTTLKAEGDAGARTAMAERSRTVTAPNGGGSPRRSGSTAARSPHRHAQHPLDGGVQPRH